MTATEVLQTIRDRQGRDVLLDGKRLLGFFEDYSKGKLKPEFNALRVLVECGGNERIAKLRDAPPARQKSELHRLVREMVTEHGMQEHLTREICEAVWEAFLGTEAPLTQTAFPEPTADLTSVSRPTPEAEKKPIPPSPNAPVQEFEIINGALVRYNGSAAEITIPANVTSIRPRAFSGNRTLRSVRLPRGLVGLTNYAFADCTGLKTISIPGSVMAVNLGSFAGCSSLRKITLESGVQKLIFGDHLDQLGRVTIEIPDSVTSVTWSNMPKAQREARMKYPKNIVASAQWISRLQDFFRDNPDFHPPEAEKKPIPPKPEAEKKPIPPKPKRVIDASTRVLLILGVLGTVGFLLLALKPSALAREFFGMESGQWRISLVCVLLAALTGWRCWRLWTEEIKPTYTTRVKVIYSAAAALFYCVVLDLCIIIFICALADMQGAVMCYMLLASLLAAVGAIFLATWHEAFFWSAKPPKLELKNLFVYPVLGIVASIAVSLAFVVLFLLIPDLIKNATGKGVVIFLWTAVQIVLVVLAYRFVKENGYLLNPTLKKQLAMISGIAVILFSLYIIYINLNFEGGARPGPIAAMLLLLVLTIKRMIHIQKRGFVFSKPSKLSLGYSQVVGCITGYLFWLFFIGVPFVVLDGVGSIGDNILMLTVIFGFGGFETLWHWSKATADWSKAKAK